MADHNYSLRLDVTENEGELETDPSQQQNTVATPPLLVSGYKEIPNYLPEEEASVTNTNTVKSKTTEMVKTLGLYNFPKDTPKLYSMTKEPRVLQHEFKGAADSHPETVDKLAETSVVSQLAAEKAKRAALVAKAKTLKEKQSIQKQQMLLDLRREQLLLEEELNMCEARTRVYQREINIESTPCEPSPHEHIFGSTTPKLFDDPDTIGQDNVLYKLLDRQVSMTESLMQHQNQALLPQPQIKPFNGKPLEFRTFIRAFENRIEKRVHDHSDRLFYLHQLTEDEPNKLVQSCLHMPGDEGFCKAKKLLEEKFGNRYLIATAQSNELLEWDTMKIDNIDQLNQFSIALVSCLNAMTDISYLTEMNNPKVIYNLMLKLPYAMRDKWRNKAQKIKCEQDRIATFKDFVSLVQWEVDILTDPIFGRVLDNPLSKSKFVKSKSMAVSTTSTDEDLDSNAKAKRLCYYCGKIGHTLDYCFAFQKLTYNERRDFVRANQMCFGCLSKGHDSKACHKKSTCRTCDKPHPTCLHFDSVPNVTNGYVNSPREPEVLMAILPVYIKVKNSRIFKTYAFLDNGSSGCFCTTNIKNKLGINCERTSLLLGTMHGQTLLDSYVVKDMVVSDNVNFDNFVPLPKVYVKDQIPVDRSNIPTKSIIQKWDYLKDLDIPKLFDIEIGLLIGNNCIEAHEPINVIPSQGGGPFAVLTRLGWTVNGVVSPLKQSFSITCNRIFLKEMGSDLNHEIVVKESVQEVIDPKVFCRIFERDFNQVELSSPSFGLSVEDKHFLEILDTQTTFKDGHFFVPLPFRDETKTPGNTPNYKRLTSLKRKLISNSSFSADYCDFMTRLIQNDYAEEVSTNLLENDSTVWYIPHHGVYNPRKPGKIRVVFDCSAKHYGKSLNDYLLQGPDMTNSLFGVLTRFREKPVCFMADIEAMFHQIKVPKDQRNSLRFLWWKDCNFNNEPIEYHMTSHPFGAVSSPSCANYALKRVADTFSCSETVSQTIKRNFYVDDCLKSCQSESEAINLAKELTSVCENGGFNLTKFVSNRRSVLESLSEDKLSKDVQQIDLKYDVLPIERALGVHWCVENDNFGFRIILRDKPSTRRGVLSVVASIFDPFGFAAPFTLKAKQILREICRDNQGWDDPISESHLSQWTKWCDQLPILEKVNINRCLQPLNFGDIKERELHVFSDASSVAYGTVIYQRLINDKNEIYCAFVTGMARLAPVKSVTIPRLELSAATLSAKLCDVVLNEMDVSPNKVVYWTDSTTVLQYIRNEHQRFHVFVSNRISTIRGLTEPENWAFVSTENNPADDASRGLPACELQGGRWLTGLAFLSDPNSTWVPQPVISKIKDNNPDVKEEPLVFATDIKDCSVKNLLEHYSDWFCLKRATAWVLRLKNVFRKWSRDRKTFEASFEPNIDEEDKKRRTRTYMSDIRKKDLYNIQLTTIDIEDAEIAILQYIQRQSFAETFKEYEKNTDEHVHVSKKSSLYRLDPIFHDGLVKVGGRLRHAEIPESVKHPIIVPKHGHITTLIIRYIHRQLGHAGRYHTIAAVRERYWIINCNAAVRHVLSQCFVCRKIRSPVLSQKMADLPKDRVTPAAPFSSIGVDYFGPFTVKEGRKELKRYGVVFTCLKIRAVHIELASSLDTSSFIQALRRFLARRGEVLEIRSDNGTNFCGAERELRQEIDKWNQNKIHKELQQRNIHWIFNPPTGSHHDGIWERQIRTIRKVLNSLLYNNNIVTLNDESLHTLMCEVEAIINSRPLTFVSEDPDDFAPLTPNCLLNLKSTSWSLPPGEFQREDLYARKAWRRVQHLTNLFWTRWQKEYLVQLQERQKWNKTRRNVSKNDIVLIVDDNLPRNNWSMARVIDTNADSLGHVRSVTVKTSSNIMQRPITKLVLLLP